MHIRNPPKGGFSYLDNVVFLCYVSAEIATGRIEMYDINKFEDSVIFTNDSTVRCSTSDIEIRGHHHQHQVGVQYFIQCYR